MTPNEQKVSETIGYLERFLVFCFILDRSDSAIAMLIAAKGVFRIHELRESQDDSSAGPGPWSAPFKGHPPHEKLFYIMIGTFASITYAVIVAILTRYLVEGLRG
jgi:hypothetical protein